MPLTIGIKNATDKGFTDEEIDITNNFPLGVICMHAGVGHLGDSKYRGTVISAEEARERFQLTLDVTGIYPQASFFYKWLTDIDNVRRMEANDWGCNVNNEPIEEFMHKCRETLFDKQVRESKFEHIHNRRSPSWNDICGQKDAVITIVGNSLSGWNDELSHSVDRLIDEFQLWDIKGTFYNGQYLTYDEDTDAYKLQANKPQEE